MTSGPWLVLLLITGCSKPKGEVFPAVTPPIVWPAPPDPARIRYVGQLAKDVDLKPGLSLGASLKQALLGKEPERSMLTPFAVCTDGLHRLFVADSNAQLVHVFDLETRRYQQWRAPGPGRTFSQPVGIAWDPRGRLLVSDSVANAIFTFDSAGTSLGDFGSEYLMRPCGMAVDAPRQRLFVADAGMHEVVVLTLDGELLARIGGRGHDPGQFNFPTNVAVDALGKLYVSDTLNSRVQVFDADLKPLRQIGSRGDMPGYFSQPKGIAIDGDNHIYVLDAHFETVQIYDQDGALLLSFGQEGSGPGEFWLPSGMFIDLQNRIWIADSYNRRVEVFEYVTEPAP
jgi:DNA-binding beta-propeller fold protein YncE